MKEIVSVFTDPIAALEEAHYLAEQLNTRHVLCQDGKYITVCIPGLARDRGYHILETVLPMREVF